MSKKRIVFDVDGIFVNFLQEISEHITEYHDIDRKKEYCTKQYNLSERFDHDFVEKNFHIFKDSFERHLRWRNIQEMPHTDLGKKIVLDSQFEVFFVTSLPVHLFEDRLNNLNQIFDDKISKEQLFCVPLGESKRPFIKALSPDIFFEDNLHNIIDCQNGLNHQSVWIDLNESYYKRDLYKDHIIKTNNLNDSIIQLNREEKIILDQTSSTKNRNIPKI